MTCIKNNGSTILKLIINHFVSGIYSLVLFYLFNSIIGGRYLYVSSIISLIFYLFLVYSLMWEAGAKDANAFYKHSIRKSDGFLLMLFGTLPSIITNVVAFVAYFFRTDSEFPEKTADLIYPVFYYINMLFCQAMYSGFFASIFGAANIHPVWYLISVIPGILFGGIAYSFGYKCYRLRTLFGIEFDEEKEKIKRNY